MAGRLRTAGVTWDRLLEAARTSKRSIDEVATAEVTRIKSSGDRISGFGHRIHTKDRERQAV